MLQRALLTPAAVLCLAAMSSSSDGVLAASPARTPAFAKAVVYKADPSEAIESADLVEDGIPDLVLSSPGVVQVMLGRGDGTFAKPATYVTDPKSLHSTGLAIADVNHSSHVEIVTANVLPANHGSYSILLGRGDGTFGRATTHPLPGSPGQGSSLALADMSGDSIPDLVVGITTPPEIAVAFGTGDGTFGPFRSYPMGGPPNSVDIAKLRAAGLPDIVSSDGCCEGGGAGLASVGIRLNRGDGTFAGETFLPVGSTYGSATGVAMASLRGGGPPDLVALDACGSGGHGVVILYNNGRGGFSAGISGSGISTGPVTALTGGPCPDHLITADLNNDGLADVVVANRTGTVGELDVFENEGSAKFNTTASVLPIDAAWNGTGGQLIAADLNCDGREDLAVGTAAGPAVLLNTTGKPSPPSTEKCGSPCLQAAPNPDQSPLGDSLPSVSCLLTSPSTAVLNGIAAVGVVLFAVFPSHLFNRTFDENHDAIREWWERKWRWTARARRRASATPTVQRRRISYTVVVVAGATIGAFLDPRFGANARTVALVIGIALAFAAATASSALAGSEYRRQRHKLPRWHVRALPSGLLIAGACVVISRITNFQPGYLYGVVGGVVFSGRLARNEEGQLVAVASVATLLVSVIAWLLWIPWSGVSIQALAFIQALIEDFLSALFLTGLVALVIGLVPLRFLPGEQLARWSWSVWAMIYAVAVFVLLEIMLRPQSANAHVSSVPFWTTVGLFITFGAASVAFWGYFRWTPPQRTPHTTLP